MIVSNQLWTPAKLVPVPDRLMEQIVDRLNLTRACKRVLANGGSAGIDGMKTDRLPAWLQRNLGKLQSSLLEGSYQSHPVRSVEIEKPGGGMRTMGIPTLVDRMIQQAIHQVLNPYFDPEFSPFSFGFRKGRSTTDAVQAVQKYQQEGKRWVIDVDLSKFFDEVNHDVLMSLEKRKVKDVRLLKLIDRYLRTGIMQGGVASPRSKGTPQGSPLSPLLSKSIRKRFRIKAKELFRKGRGMNIRRFIIDVLNPFIRGWINYYKLSNVKGFAEELDGWVRRRLRLIIWRQWKKPRTRFRRFTSMGYTYDPAMQCAYNGRGAWWNSGAQHMQFCFPKKYFDSFGLVSMLYLIVRC